MPNLAVVFYGAHLSNSIYIKLQEEMEHKFRKQFPTRKLLDIISSTRVWKIQHNAAVVIQRAWRDYRARKLGLLEKTDSGHTVRPRDSVVSQSKDHHRMLNKMGNFLHLGHHDQHPSNRGKRRVSLAIGNSGRSKANF